MEESTTAQAPPICPQCGKVKREIKEGSLTSWIFSEARCQCDIAPATSMGTTVETPDNVRPGPSNALPSDNPGQVLDRVVQSVVPGFSYDFQAQSPTSEPLWQKTGIIDRYEILEVFGQGGMGTVLKAKHINLSKLVAIKVLNPGRSLDEMSKARFAQEAQAGSALSHPNLVTVFDYGFTGDEPYLVMEFVEGESLDNLILRLGRLSIDAFLDIFSQVAKAVQYIHKHGIIHRDLKTSNIIVQTIEGECYVKLLDFGIAKILTDDQSPQQHLTATGMVFGSPLYMSPEQCMGKSTDSRSDIYSLGCVMYECLSGRPPLEGENALHTLFKHINDAPNNLTIASSADPRAAQIALIVSRCLEKDPNKRYATAGELLNALGANLSIQPKAQIQTESVWERQAAFVRQTQAPPSGKNKTETVQYAPAKTSVFTAIFKTLAKPLHKRSSSKSWPWYMNPWKVLGLLLCINMIVGYCMNLYYTFSSGLYSKTMESNRKIGEQLEKNNAHIINELERLNKAH